MPWEELALTSDNARRERQRALRLAEPRTREAQQARAWIRTALAGLHYPVFRGLDEARTLLRPPRLTSTPRTTTPTPPQQTQRTRSSTAPRWPGGPDC
ncbi:MAG: hypothetical protein ACRDQ5_06795 [Sciscionella sp.]